MMQLPLVSIIMGVYNEEAHLRNCLESVIKQTYRNWECIICDDCSTDSSKEILYEYQKKDGRFIILENDQNSRLAASLNNCLSIARGKYIARMDADDLCLPSRLQSQVQFLEENQEIDCVGSAVIVYDETGDKGIRLCKEYPQKEDLLHANPFAHPTVIIKKSVMDVLGGYTVSRDTRRAEDLDLWFRFFHADYKGYNMQKPLYKYHESEEDMQKRTFKAALGISRVYLRGYKLLGFPKYDYIYAMKPVISSVIPKRIMAYFHRNRLKDIGND